MRLVKAYLYLFAFTVLCYLSMIKMSFLTLLPHTGQERA